jgi:hypothetical protein
MVRKEPQSCVYAASRGPKTASPVSAAIKPQHAESMQQRIDRLESLVTSLASQSAPKSGDFTHRFTNLTPEGPSPSNQSRQYNAEDDTECTPDIGHGVGVLDIDENHTLYRGTTHWGDVFQEVSSKSSFVFLTTRTSANNHASYLILRRCGVKCKQIKIQLTC